MDQLSAEGRDSSHVIRQTTTAMSDASGKPAPDKDRNGAAGSGASRSANRSFLGTLSSAAGDTSPTPDGPVGMQRSQTGAAMPIELGRYRLLRTLGEGAMGTVYLAEDTQLHRQVALKIPQLGESRDSSRLERFYREARLAATLSHPNICPIYVEENELLQTDSNESFPTLVFGDPSWTDYEFSVDMMRVEGRDQGAVGFRVADGNFYLFGIGTTRNGNLSKAEVHEGPNWFVVGSSDYQTFNHTWYNVRVRA